ncbi:MAG TPA: metallophosphoesterase [Planctomicrobium sp.]|nr:metallophosphoesterase [Planctomicrobium sp.]
MSTIAFASDLHLFAKRSTADHHFNALVQAARASNEFVLGGDIFDFRWSRFSSAEETADAALNWLEVFIQSVGDCQIHYVFGNHDDHPLLHQRLPDLQQRYGQFAWNRFYYRRGNTLFLHGDVADRTMTATMLEEQRNRFEHGTRSPLQHTVYDLAVKAQLHRLAPPAVYPKKRVAKRILSYLEHVGQGPETGLQHVCFGHTHRPVDHYQINGVTFHNCGAPIGSGKFRVVCRHVDIDPLEVPLL